MEESAKVHEKGEKADGELLKGAKTGNQRALNELMCRYSLTVRKISDRYYNDHLTGDDWFQEGMIGLLYAVRTYREEQGSFGAYGAVCVRNRLNTVWKRANSPGNEPLKNYISYEDANVPAKESPEEEYIEKERYRFFTESFLEQLSETERKVICCYLAGFSYKETALKLHMTEKSVDNALCRAKSKLKKTFNK